jgi:hypothetical protein
MVMNYYYEMGDGRYLVKFGAPAANYKYLVMAHRVWCEIEGNVIFSKNRFQGNAYPVDMKEFMWVKLKCETI